MQSTEKQGSTYTPYNDYFINQQPIAKIYTGSSSSWYVENWKDLARLFTLQAISHPPHSLSHASMMHNAQEFMQKRIIL